MTFKHQSVLLAECLTALKPKDGGHYADLTLGAGGHAHAVLSASGPSGTLVGLDRDQRALAAAQAHLAEFGDRVDFVHGTFADFAARATDYPSFDGVLADIGVSSPQLDHADRGFSFRSDGPLDMRMDQSSGLTAAEYIQSLYEDELADVIYKYGEERRSRPIAASIKRAEAAGELETTAHLARAVRRVFAGGKRGRIDNATRTFQALRIAVNDELGQLERLIEAMPAVMADGGVLAIISFHSLEDRIVKWAFRNSPRWTPVTKRPITATDEERDTNPRARTAKLRSAIVVAETGDDAHG